MKTMTAQEYKEKYITSEHIAKYKELYGDRYNEETNMISGDMGNGNTYSVMGMPDWDFPNVPEGKPLTRTSCFLSFDDEGNMIRTEMNMKIDKDL